MSRETKLYYEFGPFRLDTINSALRRDEQTLPLPPKAYDTLLVLVENRGRVVSKEELIEQLWPNTFVEEANLTNNISLLRKVLGDTSDMPRYIETVPRRGYRFLASVKQVQPVAEDQSKWFRRFDGRLRILLTVSMTAVLLLLITGGWIFLASLSRHSRVTFPFHERDWVLISSFDNRTGEPLFDGTLEYALERELGNSQFVNVAPPERVEDTLRLMKKPLDTKVDAALGREVCLRDREIRALLAGRAEKLASTYVLSVSLIDPVTDQVVTSTSKEAEGEEQIATAVRRLSNWARETLGEALASIRQSDQELEKVTTPSLRALQLYTRGEALLRQEKEPVAEQLFREALAEDPEFASADMMLAWSLSNQHRPEAEWKPLSDRALELSKQVSERERYFIQGSYYSITGQPRKAIPIYEALLERYPDHYWGRNNLCFSLGRGCHDKLPCLIRRADLRPNDFRLQALAVNAASACRQKDIASRYARRANELITPEMASLMPFMTADVQFFLIHELYLQGDVDTTLKELDHLTQTIDGRSGQERDYYATDASTSYLGFGRLKAAEEFARKGSPQGFRYSDLALIALVRNDKNSLRKNLLEYLSRSKYTGWRFVLPYLLRGGLFAEARKLISLNPAWKDDGFAKVCEGEMALAQGPVAQAILLLEPGFESVRSEGDSLFLYPAAESLAAAYESKGDLSSSLRVLEETARGEEIEDIQRVFWLRIKAQLAQLYRKLNRVEDARRVENELLSLLRYADADHPILLQVRRAK